MFTLKTADYELVFEYDTAEELEQYLKTIAPTVEKIEEQKARYAYVKNELQKTKSKAEKNKAENKENQVPNTTFEKLEVAFIASRKEANRIGESSYKQYRVVFKRVKEYFKDKDINKLTIHDFIEYRKNLVEKYNIVNKTVNNHISYISKILDYGVTYKYAKENVLRGIEHLKEDKVEKELFSNTDLENIFSYDYEKNVRDTFLIAAYTGMRINEIINLKKKDIKKEEDTGIYYFYVEKSKTNAGIRKVPIHKDILEHTLKIKFPLFPDKSMNAAQKKVLRELYRVIDKNSTKEVHTFRALLINKLMNIDPSMLNVIKEIVGHDKGKDKLTLETYGKEFSLKNKKDLLDRVTFSSFKV